MVKTVTFRQLRDVLQTLGYTPERVGDDGIVFRSAHRRLFMVLPDLADQDTVRPIDMLRVRKTLANDGVVEEYQFESLFRIKKGDRLIWTEPTSGRKDRVTAAAGESDGMVIIEHEGAFMACPVDQLKRVDAGGTTDANGKR